MNSGKLIVISSPSGGGKTTVIKKLLKSNNNLFYAISATTRPPRKGERDGKDYHFISKKDFECLIQSDEFLEWAKVHEHYYGTLKSEVIQSLKSGKKIILDIDIQGGLNVKKRMNEAVLIFLMPPSMKILEKRLRNRGTETGRSIKNRLDAACREMLASDQYDYIVYNHEVDQAIRDIKKIIQF